MPEQEEAVRCNPAAEAGFSGQSDLSQVLTSRQRQILRVIHDWRERCGYAPTMREIAEAVGLKSKSSVAHQLSTLEEKGYLRRGVGRPRTVEMRDSSHSVMPPDPGLDSADGHVSLGPQEMVCIPLMGRIAAGTPIPSVQDNEGSFRLPRQLVGDGDLIALSVSGDSMINAGIFDGDWVMIRRESVPESGDIVVALIHCQEEAEATVRTFIRTGGHVWLMPHNPAYAPISCDDAVIIGKVIALFRRM
jgi:repressor LexA